MLCTDALSARPDKPERCRMSRIRMRPEMPKNDTEKIQL
jgi:hypothetical protein